MSVTTPLVSPNEQRRMSKPLQIGLFGIGLEAYWPQFQGLKGRLAGYLEVDHRKIRRPGVKVVNLGLVDSVTKAFEAGHKFREADVDLIFLYITTYALSSTVLPVVRRAKVPVMARVLNNMCCQSSNRCTLLQRFNT